MKKVFLFLFLFVITLQLTTYSQNLKGDPWIFQAYKELYNRQPTAFELNIKNYNDGSWNNYNELKKYIQDFQSSLVSQAMVVKTAVVSSERSLAGFFQNGKQVAAQILSHNGGQLIGNDAGSLVGPDGASLVGPDGASIKAKNLPGITFTNSSMKSLKSGKVIKTSGKGSFVINQ